MRPILAAVLLAAGLLTVSVTAQTLRAPPLLTAAGAETPVRVESASMHVDASAGVARTTVDLVFRNPNRRLLEGELQFPLAPGQQVAGFALDVDGVMRDAVPVAKARGRQVFEAIERRGVDPGLLEQTAGDFFRLRIYPLPAGGTRHVRITLVDALQRDGADWTSRLPMAFANGLGALDLDVTTATPPRLQGLMRELPLKRNAAGTYRVRLSRGDFDATRGLVLRMPASSAATLQRQTLDGEHWFVADVPVAGEPRARALPQRVGVLWDASMSGEHRAHDLEFALLDRYFQSTRRVEVELRLLRDRPEAPRRFVVERGDWRALRTALEAVRYDGATAPDGWSPSREVGEYLLFSDGLFNYGRAGFPPFAAGQRLYAVLAGSGDSARLTALAHARGGRAIVILNSADLPQAGAQLLRDAPRLVALQGTGVEDLVAESPYARDGVLRVAGRLRERDATLQLRIADADGTRNIDMPLARAVDSQLPALQWARFRLQALAADPERNRGEVEALGRRFGLVTPGTSLIVLEQLADYVRYDIAPPLPLRAEYERLRTQQSADRARDEQARLDAVAASWAQRAEWWSRTFPKDDPRPKPAAVAAGTSPRARAEAAAIEQRDAEEAAMSARAASEAQALEVAHSPEPAPAPVAAAPAPSPPPAGNTTLDRVEVTGSRVARDASGQASSSTDASISLQPWQPDSPYARRLRQAGADEVYALYLDERARAPQGTAFFLDVADILFEKKRPQLALRVLSNLAELELDSRHVLRVLGYRLRQAGQAELAVPVLERVRAMGEEEPQSFRDLGLAYAAAGDTQKAVDTLYEVVRGDWDGRFPGVAEIALAELNALVATSKGVDTHAVDPRLLRNLPLDLRAVLSWDSDNSDMDLWVTDPNGEKAFYSNRLTYQGGRMSNDFTGGYGPEEFALRTAKPGVYKVQANFFGDRQQLVTGATTLNLWLSTGFGTARQVNRTVTLRLKERSETVLVGEFEVK